MRNLSGQSIRSSMQNLESVAQKMAELLHYIGKRTFRAGGGGRGGGAHFLQWIIQSKLLSS